MKVRREGLDIVSFDSYFHDDNRRSSGLKAHCYLTLHSTQLLQKEIVPTFLELQGTFDACTSDYSLRWKVHSPVDSDLHTNSLDLYLFAVPVGYST